jgi:putative oxidoreductase
MGLGTLILTHGLMKIFVYTVAGTIGFFESVGFPGVLAIPVIVVEIVGGLMLLVGLKTRWASLTLVPILLGATSVHLGNGFTFNNPGGGWEFTAFLAVALLALFLYGDDGRLSLAGALRGREATSPEPSRVRPAA